MIVHGIGKPSIKCQCNYRFTCGYCLRNAPPWHFTPSTISEQVAQDRKEVADDDHK
jgi:hypothetical protein